MGKVLKSLFLDLLYILFVFAITFVIIKFVGQRTEVIGDSMLPQLCDGDNLITDKISYRFRDPERFDVIVFPYQYEDNTNYIKRIIGMPGETIYIDPEGNIHIDGKILKENFGREIIRADRIGIASEPITIGEDEYFVLGDNRNNSKDSRDPSVGLVKREIIIGRAWVRIWPLSKIGKVRHQ